MPDKYIIQRRTASGLETVAELPALENGKIDMSWLPVVGESGAAIIARGSNANGEWVRWADGTQVCWINNISATPQDGVFSWTYPASFVSKNPAIVTMPQYHGNTMWAPCIIGYSQTSDNSVNMTRLQYKICNAQTGELYTQNGRFFSFLAIGRWK